MKTNQKKKNIVVSLNCGKTTAGYAKNSTSNANKRHPRVSKTRSNKIKKLKSKYRRLFKNSKKTKKENPNSNEKKILRDKKNSILEGRPKKDFFCDRYPTIESFLKQYNLKEVGTSSSVKKTTNKKELKEKARQTGLLGEY